MLKRLPQWARWLIVIAVLVGAPIAWYLGSPLFLNRTVDESLPAEGMPQGAGPSAVVARGTFVDGDDFHKGEGTATIYKVGPDLILRLDPFRTTNGPDLRVFLTRAAAPKTRSDVQAGYVEIAKLKGNIGSQNYTLPKDINLSDYKAVVIYCRPFHVVFATATLGAGN